MPRKLLVSLCSVTAVAWFGLAMAQPPAAEPLAGPPLDAPPFAKIMFRNEMRSADDVMADHEVHELVQKISEEKDATKKADLMKQAKDSLSKQFDARQEARKAELADLEERVKNLRELFDRRQQAKDDIIQSRVDELLREADGLGWGEGSVGPEFSASPAGRKSFNRKFLPSPDFAPGAAPPRGF